MGMLKLIACFIVTYFILKMAIVMSEGIDNPMDRAGKIVAGFFIYISLLIIAI